MSVVTLSRWMCMAALTGFVTTDKLGGCRTLQLVVVDFHCSDERGLFFRWSVLYPRYCTYATPLQPVRIGKEYLRSTPSCELLHRAKRLAANDLEKRTAPLNP